MEEQKLKQFQYFPGHMKKSLIKIEELCKIATGAIVVLDGRAPQASFPLGLHEIIKKSNLERVIYIFTKTDLCDEEKLNEYISSNYDKSIKTFSLNLKNYDMNSKLLKVLETTTSKKDDKYAKLGFPLPPIEFIIMGIPNVGKSTLINYLFQKKRAQVENRPGKTRTTNIFKVNNRVNVIDSPGILEPNYKDKDIIKKLALLGSVNLDAIPFDELFEFLVEILHKDYYERCLVKYSIDSFENSYDLLHKMGKAKLVLTKNGEVNYEKCKMMIFKDFQEGRLGRIFLD